MPQARGVASGVIGRPRRILAVRGPDARSAIGTAQRRSNFALFISRSVDMLDTRFQEARE